MCGVVEGEGSDTDVASLSRAIIAGRPPSPESPRAAALRLLVLVVLVEEDMVALGYSNGPPVTKNDKK